MIDSNTPPVMVHTDPVIDTGSPYCDWGAILAGAVFAAAISFVLLSFGGALGLSLTSPYPGEGVSANWLAIAAGLWFIWVVVSSFGAGGYLTGRLRRRAGDASRDEVEMRDGAHGLIVWAAGTVIAVLLTASGVSGIIGAGGAVIGKVAEVAAESEVTDYYADLMLRNTTQEINVDAEAASRVAGILRRGAVTGEIVERDREYLAQVVEANTDLDAAAARERVDMAITEINEARDEAVAAAEQARIAGVISGFVVAATFLLGAVVAFFAASAGGRHRDEGLDFSGRAFVVR